jgi:AraC-like DNA-binding protein
MNQLSGELYLSLSQVQRKVMAITNYTPSELFRNHRLKNAAALFRSGHVHVAQVMHRVGFNNQSYFTKCFGELFKMTPSQFISANKIKQ